MEASSGISRASRDPIKETVSARVTTRAFGIRVGPFGLDYSSKQVVVDPEDRLDTKRDTREQSFRTEMERERLRERVVDASWREAAQGASGTGQGAYGSSQTVSGRDNGASAGHPDPAWRRGLAAYARAREALLADAARSAGTTLAVA